MNAVVTKESITVPETIAEELKKYIITSEKIKEYSNQLKKLKEEQKEHENIVLDYMKTNNLTYFSLGDKVSFSLQVTKKNNKKVNKDTIKSELERRNVSTYVISDVIESLYTLTPDNTVEVTKVKVTKKI